MLEKVKVSGDFHGRDDRLIYFYGRHENLLIWGRQKNWWRMQCNASGRFYVILNSYDLPVLQFYAAENVSRQSALTCLALLKKFQGKSEPMPSTKKIV